jgi:hypothetical protein
MAMAARPVASVVQFPERVANHLPAWTLSLEQMLSEQMLKENNNG